MAKNLIRRNTGYKAMAKIGRDSKKNMDLIKSQMSMNEKLLSSLSVEEQEEYGNFEYSLPKFLKKTYPFSDELITNVSGRKFEYGKVPSSINLPQNVASLIMVHYEQIKERVNKGEYIPDYYVAYYPNLLVKNNNNRIKSDVGIVSETIIEPNSPEEFEDADPDYDPKKGSQLKSIFSKNSEYLKNKYNFVNYGFDGLDVTLRWADQSGKLSGEGKLDLSRSAQVHSYSPNMKGTLEQIQNELLAMEETKPIQPEAVYNAVVEFVGKSKNWEDFKNRMASQLYENFGLTYDQIYSYFEDQTIPEKQKVYRELVAEWDKIRQKQHQEAESIRQEMIVDNISEMAIQAENEMQARIIQSEIEKENPPVSNPLSDEFFRTNPSKILGESSFVSDRFGGQVMFVKGDFSNLSGIDVPDVVEFKSSSITSEISETINQIILGEGTSENFDIAIEEQEKRIAKKAVKRVVKKKRVEDEVEQEEIEVEMVPFDEFLKTYNPNINNDELAVWVWWNSDKGSYLGGEWAKFMPQTSNDWFLSMMDQGYLCFDYVSGRYIPSPIYYAGNILSKTSDLLRYRDNKAEYPEVPVSQWDKQYARLNEIKPKSLTLSSLDPNNRLIIAPISELAKTYMINKMADGTELEKEMSLQEAFTKYLRALPETEFELPVKYWDIERRYLDNESDRSKSVSKEEKFETKKNARIEGDRLFQKFLYEEIFIEDKIKIEHIWNQKYNSWVDINYSKIPVAFECSRKFKKGALKFRPAQIEGVAFNSINGTGIVAYEVGVGKTATLIGLIAHLLQSGQSKRPLIIVPNPTYEKWKKEINGIYDSRGRMIGSGILPQYKINDLKNLGVDYIGKMFDSEGIFIPIEEYSITIMTYEALEKIGFNEQKNQAFISKMMAILDDGSDSGKARDVAVLKQKAEKYMGKAQKETVLDFDMFDFDFIGIDEAHNFKNVFTSVKGTEKEGKYYDIQGSVSARGIKAFFMTQWIFDKTGGKNVCLLTATPFTNNPLEVFSMLSMCSFVELKRRGISSLREFFDTYVKQTYEIVYGSDFQFKEKAVIKQWNNRISLQSLIFSFVNYKSGEDAGIQRPNKIVLPLFKQSINGTVVELDEEDQISTFLMPTEKQREYLKQIEDFVLGLSTLADICSFAGAEDGCEPPESIRKLQSLSDEEAEAGKVLRALSFSRQVTLSPYLYACNDICGNPNSEGFYKDYIETSPKLLYTMRCIASVKKWHEDRNESVSGQIIYMDAGKDYFKYLKEYLVKEVGYSEDQVAFITSEISQDKREEIKKDFLSGEIKIVIGTSSIKEGIDLQEKTSVLYNLWLDWRPTDIAQLEGRAWRFGNMFKNVRIVTPMVENSIDPFMFQKLEEKTSRINDIFDRSGKSNVLNIEEFNPEELKLGLITDPFKRAKEKIRFEVKNLEVEKAKIQSKIEGIDQIKSIVSTIDWLSKRLINQAQYKHDWLVRYYNNRTVEYRKANGEIDTKVVDAVQWLNEHDMATPEDINIVEKAVEFGKYYDKLSNQTEFSYQSGQYRDNKKKLINLEKSILIPRGLSLNDDISTILDSLKNELAEIDKNIEFLKSDDNTKNLVNKFVEEIRMVESKRKSLDERVNDFAKLNDKLLSEYMDYSGEQAQKIESFNVRKEIESETEQQLENEAKEAAALAEKEAQINNLKAAIEIMRELLPDLKGKEKKEMIAAIEITEETITLI